MEDGTRIEQKGRKEGRKESKVRNETCARTKKEKAVSGFSYIETVPRIQRDSKERDGGRERGSYNLNLLPNDRLGTRIVPRCQPRRIFHRNEAIPQREIKIPLLFYCTAREIYAPAKLCLISPPDEGGREAWILRKRFDRV